MGTKDCQFPPAVELQEVTEVPRCMGISLQGKLGNSDNVNTGGMSPTLRDPELHAVVEVEPQGSRAQWRIPVLYRRDHMRPV